MTRRPINRIRRTCLSFRRILSFSLFPYSPQKHQYHPHIHDIILVFFFNKKQKRASFLHKKIYSVYKIFYACFVYCMQDTHVSFQKNFPRHRKILCLHADKLLAKRIVPTQPCMKQGPSAKNMVFPRKLRRKALPQNCQPARYMPKACTALPRRVRAACAERGRV